MANMASIVTNKTAAAAISTNFGTAQYPRLLAPVPRTADLRATGCRSVAGDWPITYRTLTAASRLAEVSV
jgi:hypothetical protein